MPWPPAWLARSPHGSWGGVEGATLGFTLSSLADLTLSNTLATSGAIGLTSTVGIRDDVTNAGGCWEDAEVVVDGNIVSSRVFEPDEYRGGELATVGPIANPGLPENATTRSAQVACVIAERASPSLRPVICDTRSTDWSVIGVST